MALPYHKAGYTVIESSARTGIGIDTLRERTRGVVSLFTGSTGVGKSSLVNAIQPGLELRTAPVSAKGKRGRHTTVAAEMHPLTNGGFVVDTPGLRDIGLWALDPGEVARAFPEIARYARDCRFDDCRHVHEPDCAVIAARDAGHIAASRHESYVRLLEEAENAVRPWE